MDHSLQDKVGLELAIRIQEALPEHPEWLEEARTNLDRWSARNSSAASLLRCYAEWRELLERPVPEICAVLIADTEEGRRLRQNSPFVGMLPPAASGRSRTGYAMQRPHLEHLIRASAAITGAREFIVVGSQAVLGQFPDAPEEMLVSSGDVSLPLPLRPWWSSSALRRRNESRNVY